MRKSGKVIRVSDAVHEVLKVKRLEYRSWDALFRALLGLPTRKGTPSPLREFHIVEGGQKVWLTKAQAKGEALILKVSQELPEEPQTFKVREVI